MYAWGRNAPTVPLEVRVPLPSDASLYVTMNVFTLSGSLVERVSLRDDGQYDDQTAGDGIFTGQFIPKEEGEFQVRARLYAKEKAAERWSEVARFVVERVPYADITAPDPDATTGTRFRLRAVLVIGPAQQPYTPAQDRVRVVCWTQPPTKTTTAEVSASRITVPLDLIRPGRYRVMISAQTYRRGQWIDTEPDSLWLNAVVPPRWPFVVAAVLFLVSWLLPSAEVKVYKHSLRIRRANGQVRDIEIPPQRLSEVSKTVGGAGCDIVLENVQGQLFRLISRPGEQYIYIQLDNADSPKRLSPNPNVVAQKVQGEEVYYLRSKPEGRVRLPFWKLTRLKKGVLILSVLLLCYAVWSYWRFTQMIAS